MGKKQNSEIQAWHSFLWAHTVILSKLEREMRDELRLPLPWFDVLAQLEHAPEGRMRMSQLASSLVLSSSGLTRRLDQMEKASFIRRELSSDDRRGFYAILTDGGREVLARAWPFHLRGIRAHFLKYLTHDEIAVLNKAFTRIINEESKEPTVGDAPSAV